jgi:TRAP-type C4-dicarboxylate transport system substrate-binding protein
MRANSPENSEFIKRFGGIPITMATPEVASALQRGVFPAVITAAAGAGQLWVEMLRFMLDVGPSYTVSFVLVGKPSFDELTLDQQKALRTAVSEETAGVSGKMRKQNDELLAKFVTGGFKIAPGSAAQEKQVVDTMRPYWTEWAKRRGDAAATALKTAQQALGK